MCFAMELFCVCASGAAFLTLLTTALLLCLLLFPVCPFNEAVSDVKTARGLEEAGGQTERDQARNQGGEP